LATSLPYMHSSARRKMEDARYIGRQNRDGDEDMNTSFETKPDMDPKVLDG
jgi:hypothetical protein